MPLDEKLILDLYMRKEVAHNVFRLFALISPHVAFTFDETGVTIHAPFTTPVDLGDHTVIYGYSRGVGEYHERYMDERRT